ARGRFIAPRPRRRPPHRPALHLDGAAWPRRCRSSGRGRAAGRARGHRPARPDDDVAMTVASPRSIVQGGIIAAGHGTRLRADGYLVSKPMVPVAGRPLIDLTLARFRAAGVRRLTIIINESSDDCRQWLHQHVRDFDLDLIVRTTPSSYA